MISNKFLRALARIINPRVPLIKDVKILRVPGNCSLEYSRVPLHRGSKFYGCQAPVAPVLTTTLLIHYILTIQKYVLGTCPCAPLVSTGLTIPRMDVGKLYHNDTMVWWITGNGSIRRKHFFCIRLLHFKLPLNSVVAATKIWYQSFLQIFSVLFKED